MTTYTRLLWHHGRPCILEQGQHLHHFDRVCLHGRASNHALPLLQADAEAAALVLRAHGHRAPWDGREGAT